MDEIVVKVCAKHKEVADAFEHLMKLIGKFEQSAGESTALVDYREHEAAVADATAVIERKAHQACLQALDIDAPSLLIDGKEHRAVGRHRTQYNTLRGPADVVRTLYREAGVRNGPTTNTVTLRSGAVLGEWLPKTASTMAHRISRGTSREAEQSSQEETTLPYGRSSFERVGHEVGRRCVVERVEIEETLAQELQIPEETKSLSVSVDRVSVPMEEKKPRPVGRPKKGAPKRPINVAYRMAYCATLTLHDGEGKAMHTTRYGRMPQGDEHTLVEALASDALSLLKKRPDLAVSSLADGAEEMWNLLQRHVDEESFGTVHRLVDFWHVLEKLSAAAKVLAQDEEAAKRLLGKFRMTLLNRVDGAHRILKQLKDSGCAQIRVGQQRPVHEAITYLTHHQGRMNYKKARELGLPIGSGNVEASCKSLFALRMKRPGSRWLEQSGQRIVTLRAHQLSDRFSQATQLALKPPPVQISLAA